MSQLDADLKAAIQLAQSGRLDLAIPAFQQVLRQDPAHAEANKMLAIAYLSSGQPQPGIQHIQQAIAAVPARADLHHLLGEALAFTGQIDAAMQALDRSIELDPAVAQPHALLATCLLQRQDLDGAADEYAEAVRLHPKYPEARTNLGNVLTMTGRPQEGAQVLREAARDHPAHLGVLTNYCVALNYAEGVGLDELRAAHEHFGRVLMNAPGGPAMDARAFANARDPEKKLRIGILSSDLFDHSVAYFIRPMLEHRDRSRFEFIVYSAGHRQDAITRRIQSCADAWRDVSRAGDQQLIQQVRTDGIDILIELSGQTHGNRLAALRLRGAPVQVSCIGYPNTTGVPAIDYRIVDSLTDPPGAEAQATERLIRLDPCFLCFTPREDAPAPGPSPSRGNVHITFGSFNSIKKLTPGTLRLWGRLLRETPGARFIIKSGGLSSEQAQRHVESIFESEGIDSERVDLLDKIESKLDHLAAYDMLDVALDTFPYNGTTTTCEALWQGVPVVSLAGDRHASRVGLSLLSAVGFADWAASTPDDYIRAARALAEDPALRDRLREGELRRRFAASPLGDAPAMGRRVGEAMRTIWRDHCSAP